jgi:hypothetical protein
MVINWRITAQTSPMQKFTTSYALSLVLSAAIQRDPVTKQNTPMLTSTETTSKLAVKLPTETDSRMVKMPSSK